VNGQVETAARSGRADGGAAATEHVSDILVVVEQHVATVTINRPDRMNALGKAANRHLRDALIRVRDDDDVWAVVLTGSGDRAFCAGGDLKEEAEEEEEEPPAPIDARVGFGGGLTGVAGRRLVMPKPLIAAVNGYAIGGGFELAMSCDVIVAAECATFSLPEARVGWISDSPCVHRAVRSLPHHIAMGLILTGRPLDAATAAHFGLVNQVAPPQQVLTVAYDWAASMTSCSPLATRALKEAAIVGLEAGLDQALATRWETIEEFQFSADRMEGTLAFRAKREPHWTGR
jgi:enoyl-CoA hydratase/carnithine racemase